MATQSTDDPNKTPGQELGLGKNEDPQVATTEDAKVSSSGSPFVNSEPIREYQVQNAVKFLSHPNVRVSPVMYRRSFLEKKGLTKEEIDEAFRRVPDPSPDAQATNKNQDTKSGFPSNAQQQALTVAAPPGVVSTTGTRNQYRFHWSHAIFAIGFIATSGAGTVLLVKRVVIPRLKSWIRKIVKEEDNGLPPSLAEETAAAAKAAAAAATDVARVSHELLDSRTQVSSFCAELRNVLDFQLQEMKAMTNALSSLQVQAKTSVTATSFINSLQQQQPYANGKTESYTRTASVEPSVAPHPPSYMEILSMVQRGEKPPNVKEIDDSPPNPNQQISDPRLAPRMKPWEVGPTQKTSNPSATSIIHNTQGNGFYSQPQVDTSIPWWQRKNVQEVEVNGEEQSNVTQKSLTTLEQPVQRRWVPPQPPPVVMPEAAEAIKRPKPSPVSKGEGGLVADNHSVLPPLDAPGSSNSAISSEEVSTNGVTNMELNSNEIKEDEDEQTRAPEGLLEA